MKVRYYYTSETTIFNTDSEQFHTLIRTEERSNVKWKLMIKFHNGGDIIEITDEESLISLESMYFDYGECEIDPMNLIPETIKEIIKEYEN